MQDKHNENREVHKDRLCNDSKRRYECLVSREADSVDEQIVKQADREADRDTEGDLRKEKQTDMQTD